MKSITISFLICSISFVSFAQDRDPLDLVIDDITYKLKLEDLDMRKEIFDGKEYGCFGKKETSLLLQLRLDFPKLVDKIRNQKSLLQIRENKIVLMGQMNVNLKDQSNFLMKEISSLQIKLEERDAWYRSPLLWFCVGAILASGSTVLIVYLVK